MTNEPKFGMEPWSPAGRRAVLMARWGGCLHGVFLILFTLIVLSLSLYHGGHMHWIGGTILAVVFVYGVATFILSLQVGRSRRGMSVAVLVLSLVLSLVASFYVGLFLYAMFTYGMGMGRMDLWEFFLLSVIFAIPLSGFFTAVVCVLTLRRWPRRTGMAFHVELVSLPPTEVGGNP